MDQVKKALDQGVAALCRAQEADGRFVDFELPPGASDGWVTGFVAVALASSTSAAAQAAVERAAWALAGLARPGGWGYNLQTAPDGDSTAFAVRVLLQAGLPLPAPAADLLGAYCDESGAAHTYRDARRMGAWAGVHADVTPSVGLALLAAGGQDALVERTVKACLAARGADGLWRGYWWRTPCYATWLNLEFLGAAGALTRAAALEARVGLRGIDGDLAVLDVACLVGALTEISRVSPEAGVLPLAAYLARLQQPNGLWPPSFSLLLPPQQGGDEEPTCHADTRGLFTTAAAVRALARAVAFAG